MDSLLVDLDKVLDDFEAEEDEAPGNERKPSGFHEFLEKSNEQTFKVIDSYIPASEIQQNDQHPSSQSTDNIQNVCYDFPYEPENFDLSEADFAPSPTLGDSGYNGSLSYSAYSDYDEQKLTKRSGSGTSVENQNGSSLSFDKSEDMVKAAVDVTSKNVLSKDSTVIKNDLQSGKFKLTYPVQADNSPSSDRAYYSGEINGYGNYQWTDALMPKQNNSDVNSETSAIRQVSVQSFTSTDSKSDPDKYPVQCNTPQTPKENMLMNPLDSQISSLGSSVQNSSTPGQDLGALSNSSQDVMQDKSGLDSKLSHLKHTISGGIAKGEVDYDKNVFMNASNSLPASFHANLSEKNDQHSSLPLNLSNGMQDKPVNDERVEYCNGDIGKPDNTEETNFSDIKIIGQVSEVVTGPKLARKEQMEVADSVNEQSVTGFRREKPVVGFGTVDDDVMEESHMDDYLKDMEVNDKTVTDAIEYTMNNTDYMDDLEIGTCREVIDKAHEKEINNFNKMTDDDKQRYQSFDHAEGDISTITNKSDIYKGDMLAGKSYQSQHGTGYNQITNPAVDVIQVLPMESAPSNVSISKPVISDLDTNLSPSGLVSIDSGLASLTDNVTDSGSFPSPVREVMADVGARPKDTNNRLTMPSGMKDPATANFSLKPSISPTAEEFNRSDDSPKFQNVMINELTVSVESEIKQRMDNGEVSMNTDTVETMDTSNTENPDTESTTNNEHVNLDGVELRRPLPSHGGQGSAPAGRPRSWSPSDSGQPPVQKQKRPTSLNLPPLPQINLTDRSTRDDDSNLEEIVGAESGEGGEGMAEGSYPGAEADLDNGSLEGAVGGEEIPYIPPDDPGDFDPPPSYSSTLGNVAPKWIPDAEAPSCMSCDARFTFTKRRHHCRACGKVFCSTCCNMKARLVHMKNQEARVCLQCHQELHLKERGAHSGFGQRGPHPNNPGDYCSVVPPQQGASSSPPPPSVLVPVLKRDGNGNGGSREEGTNRRSEPKQVMFSDGIRPGGDLTELDGSSEVTRLPPRRTRVQKRVEKVSSGGQHSSRSRRVRTMAERSLECYIPAEGLPPVLIPKPDGIGFDLQKNPDPSSLMTQIKDETSPPVIFTINPNLHLLVKIINLDCCVNRVVWCITTKGMTSAGQEEIVTVLETVPDEPTIPRDLFTHLNAVYDEASKGNPVTELGHTIFNQNFLDSREHGGFLYIRSTFQCTQKLILPTPPYLFGILLQKWETPWAKVFPIRLLLRLGAEYRYYPCPLIGVRNRKPVFFEIGHTIMNLLADFRNYQYMLPSIKGITIHMEDKVTKINFPRNTYEDLMKVVNNSNEHVMAVGANFSPDADSHLVCIQNDDGNYQTQAINIQNKPRKVTGASFVVFNGALKTSSGLTAKSSIVEDGLMVQISPDSMLALKQAMKDMQDYTITCAVIGAPKPDETVIVQWVDDDKNINIGVKSPIDGMIMDGVESLRIQNSIDYIGERLSIRWTEIFFIQNRDGGSVKWEPVDLSRLGETLATAFCVALTPHLQNLKDADLIKIGLRVTLGADNVGYEAGAQGERLPDVYMNDLDNELIPVIHRATQADGSMVLEMIFQILE